LSTEEQDRLLRYLPLPAARVVHFAHLTGMPAGQIFILTWDQVDLAPEPVRLGSEDTETSEVRVIFLCEWAYDIITKYIRSLDRNRVLTYRGKSREKIKQGIA
jgi:hypothetical protein